MNSTSVVPISTVLRRTFSGRVFILTRHRIKRALPAELSPKSLESWNRTNDNGFYRPICKYLLYVSLSFYI